MKIPQDLIDRLVSLHKKGTFLIAIDGRSGSGKSVLADAIKEHISNISIVHLDTYDLYDGKLSIQRVIHEVLEPLKKADAERRMVIVEGIFALTSELIPFYDYKIWVECPEKVGFARGLKRDMNLNGIDNSEKWINYWLPKEREYIENERPEKKADYVVDSTIELE